MVFTNNGVFSTLAVRRLKRSPQEVKLITIQLGAEIPISKGPVFNLRDIYVDYPFEEVMFRWDHITKKIYVRFYGTEENLKPVPQDNRLFNDALRYGDETTPELYQKGAQRR